MYIIFLLYSIFFHFKKKLTHSITECPFCCLSLACRDDQFTCQNGQCIPLIRKCDRRNDCADASDEEGCGMLANTDVY